MNRVKLAILIIAIIALASGTWIIVEKMQEQTTHSPEIKIDAFNWTSGWETPGGVQAIKQFNLTIHNLGNKDVDNVTVEVEMFDANGKELDSATAFFGPGTIGTDAELTAPDSLFHAGEVRELRGIIMTNWGEIGQANTLGGTITTGIKV